MNSCRGTKLFPNGDKVAIMVKVRYGTLNRRRKITKQRGNERWGDG